MRRLFQSAWEWVLLAFAIAITILLTRHTPPDFEERPGYPPI